MDNANRNFAGSLHGLELNAATWTTTVLIGHRWGNCPGGYRASGSRCHKKCTYNDKYWGSGSIRNYCTTHRFAWYYSKQWYCTRNSYDCYTTRPRIAVTRTDRHSENLRFGRNGFCGIQNRGGSNGNMWVVQNSGTNNHVADWINDNNYRLRWWSGGSIKDSAQLDNFDMKTLDSNDDGVSCALTTKHFINPEDSITENSNALGEGGIECNIKLDLHDIGNTLDSSGHHQDTFSMTAFLSNGNTLATVDKSGDIRTGGMVLETGFFAANSPFKIHLEAENGQDYFQATETHLADNLKVMCRACMAPPHSGPHRCPHRRAHHPPLGQEPRRGLPGWLDPLQRPLLQEVRPAQDSV
jgi:hypothetical protein